MLPKDQGRRAGGWGQEKELGRCPAPTVTAPGAGRARWSRVFAGCSCLCPDLAPLWGRPKNSPTVQPGSKVEAPAPLRSPRDRWWLCLPRGVDTNSTGDTFPQGRVGTRGLLGCLGCFKERLLLVLPLREKGNSWSLAGPKVIPGSM